MQTNSSEADATIFSSFGAATLDHVAGQINLVSTIDVDDELRGIEIQDRNAVGSESSVGFPLEATAASKVCLILANSSMKKLAVEPVPTPTTLLRSSLGAI